MFEKCANANISWCLQQPTKILDFQPYIAKKIAVKADCLPSATIITLLSISILIGSLNNLTVIASQEKNSNSYLCCQQSLENWNKGEHN